MTPLAFPFRAGGFDHTLLAREGDVCLVGRSWPHLGGWAHYEIVILRRRAPHRLPNGILLPEREVYPAPTDWGRYGWSYVDRTKAERWHGAVCRRWRSRTAPKSVGHTPAIGG